MTSQSVFHDVGFVLHSRKFRENSMLLDVLTEHHGRVGLVARRAMGKRQRAHNPFQQFREMALSWRGRQDLQSLNTSELVDSVDLRGRSLVCGLYCNELIIRLTGRHEQNERLYQQYRQTLRDMSQGGHIEPALRRFEHCLLVESGHGIDFYHDSQTSKPLAAADQYFFDPSQGFSVSPFGRQALRVSAEQMLGMRETRFEDKALLECSKQVYSRWLERILGREGLKTKSLFREMTTLTATRRRHETRC